MEEHEWKHVECDCKHNKPRFDRERGRAAGGAARSSPAEGAAGSSRDHEMVGVVEPTQLEEARVQIDFLKDRVIEIETKIDEVKKKLNDVVAYLEILITQHTLSMGE